MSHSAYKTQTNLESEMSHSAYKTQTNLESGSLLIDININYFTNSIDLRMRSYSMRLSALQAS
jgi:hypothetical protein